MNTTTNNHNTHQGAEGKDAPAHQHGTGTDVEHDHRHLGGLKAALHNPNVSFVCADKNDAPMMKRRW